MAKIIAFLKARRRRIAMSLAGVIICAVSVGIFKLAALGVDPFQSLMSGLDALIPIEFGTLYDITQFSYAFLQGILPDPSLPVRIACLVIGIVIICFGSALYMTADLGVSTYDAVAIVMSSKWHWGKFKYIRIITDLVCVAAGCTLFVLAGNALGKIPTIAGAGTIITAFFMGPLIDFFNVKVARPLLEG